MEFRVYEGSLEELKATKNSNYIFAWWFKLDADLIATDDFFHIFQLKACSDSCSNVTALSMPLMTLSLANNDGYHIPLIILIQFLDMYYIVSIGYHFRLWKDDRITEEHRTILPLEEALGKWLQVTIESQFSQGNCSSCADPGYVRVTLKDENGTVLFPVKQEDTYAFNNMVNEFRNYSF